MNNHIGFDFFNALEHIHAVSDVQLVVRETSAGFFEASLIPPCIALRTEEVGAHVVVDAVYFPAEGIEICDNFGADETGGTGYE